MQQRRRSKAAQKNVSVYLGSRDGWQHQVLELVCQHLNVTESELFRELYFERLVQWGLYDPETRRPVAAAIDRLRQERKAVVPRVLFDDQHEDDDDKAVGSAAASYARGEQRG